MPPSKLDRHFMQRALRLARRGLGWVSPNPMVGAVLVRGEQILGEGWHERAGQAHAEVRAIEHALAQGNRLKGATLYVSLEPCCTTGRTPPCTRAILSHGIGRVVVASEDPNPAHAGRGLQQLSQQGIRVDLGVEQASAQALNQAFFHWIATGTPHVTLKSAMTLDGKIATASGQSQWITGEAARRDSMRLRQSMDAILVGRETVVADDPSLTVRLGRVGNQPSKPLLRIILDSKARMPLHAKVLHDEMASLTRVVVTQSAPASRLRALGSRTTLWQCPSKGRVDLHWLMHQLGQQSVTALLVEGGGEVHASFLEADLAHEVVFYYAPKVLGGLHARRSVAGKGATSLDQAHRLSHIRWRKVGEDLRLQARVNRQASGSLKA
jgi:diaminohydroxyphosphoribosylaminopyrimidine deaminase/5-amino-6-(5-phosphoribosylamino)uracil reductase